MSSLFPMKRLLSRLPRPSTARPDLVGARLVLRPPHTDDFKAYAAVRTQSAASLRPFEPQESWTQAHTTAEGFARRCATLARASANDRAYAFHIFTKDACGAPDALIGGINLSRVTRGPGQMASLGYWMGANARNQGYMTDAVRLLTQHAFTALALHRLDAACVPENAASKRVLEKCGFMHEGLARKYIRIDGAWRDHLLYGLTVEDWEQAQRRTGHQPPLFV